MRSKRCGGVAVPILCNFCAFPVVLSVNILQILPPFNYQTPHSPLLPSAMEGWETVVKMLW